MNKEILLKAWFNSDRGFDHGAGLYFVLGDNAGLKKLFQKGETPYLRERLHEELEKLLSVCYVQAPAEPEPTPAEPELQQQKKPELEKACDEKAKLLWKQMMNDRAVLFNLTKVDAFDHINNPDLVEKRRILALNVCTANYTVSKAYSDLEHVRIHGSLPDHQDKKETIDDIPDTDVKAAIDNIRKNLSKIRKREQTPERISLIQQHQFNLEKLLTRWEKLNPLHKNRSNKGAQNQANTSLLDPPAH